MKKTIVAMMIMAMTAASVAGCGSSSNDTAAADTTAESTAEAADTTTADDTAAAGSMSGAISVLSREDGSGTRGAFIELFGIEQKDADGNKVDNTIDSAEITNSTSVMMTTVAGNKNAIGYVSLGSLDENQVKAVLIDGAQATAENVKDGTYKVSRPFNITIGGSSSVTPVMEKLKEAYAAVNPNATIEVQQSDSTTGMTSTIDGTYDIGMASRELKDEEAAELTGQVIALDGIAVIVNKENTIDELTSEDVLNIYTGATTDWSEIAQ